MPRYELVKGKKKLFWSIELEKDEYTVTEGAIGTEGKSWTKLFLSKKDVKPAYEKAIAAKVAEGYVLAGAVQPEVADDRGGAQRFELSEGGSNKFWEIA